ncbi:acyl-CoA dehydrogenase family protein [Nocardia sp. NPDC047038]|uniref:acyl-CoA dehydrogenase family protein n=1 Tax=Nocardia sp. NPDC047038 TaxID=3154338 RepID=UPI0033F6B212
MNTSLIPPLRAFPPEADALRAEVRAFLIQDRATHGWQPHVDSWISSWDPGFSERLAGRGWLGMTVPTEYGGHGRTHLDRFVVTEELLAAGAPVAAHWVADRQVVPALLSYGTDGQRREYLPAIAEGKCFFAIGMSEPESGSDLASVRTKATRVDGGWELTGTKVWTSGAHHAHAFFVLARSAPLDAARRHDGLSQFIVTLDAPGIEIRPIRLLTGQHHFNEVVLDHVFVPDHMVLGTPGEGWRQVTSELGFERSGPERILSTQPLLEAFLTRLADSDDSDTASVTSLGALVARLTTLRQLSSAVANALSDGKSADLSAALVKDLGTRYEGDVVEVAATAVATDADPGSADEFTRLLGEGLLHTPGFTLRGGTSEILRGVVARGLGLR